MKVVCIINARGNSKGLPGKNIRMFGDKPLIAHTIESAINSKICDRVVVSTDDEEIAEISREYGAETPFMRPKDLANEFVHPEKSLVHAVEEIISSGYQFDITVMRDCTEPFIDWSVFIRRGILSLQHIVSQLTPFYIRKHNFKVMIS